MLETKTSSFITGALTKSQFPVFTIYAQKSCLGVRPCERAWCFDRVRGYHLKGRGKRTHTVGSRQMCLDLCLGENEFVCRYVNTFWGLYWNRILLKKKLFLLFCENLVKYKKIYEHIHFDSLYTFSFLFLISWSSLKILHIKMTVWIVAHAFWRKSTRDTSKVFLMNINIKFMHQSETTIGGSGRILLKSPSFLIASSGYKLYPTENIR